MTFPRFRGGIPVTLGVRSSNKANDGSNLVDPFPDYSWHANPTEDCNNRMVSVFRIAVSKFAICFHEFVLMKYSTSRVDLMVKTICDCRLMIASVCGLLMPEKLVLLHHRNSARLKFSSLISTTISSFIAIKFLLINTTRTRFSLIL